MSIVTIIYSWKVMTTVKALPWHLPWREEVRCASDGRQPALQVQGTGGGL